MSQDGIDSVVENGFCSCDEMKIFSFYRGWNEACQATRTISTTWRFELPLSFFPLQGKAPEEIHAFPTETLGEHEPFNTKDKTGWSSFNVVIFPPVFRLVMDDPKE